MINHFEAETLKAQVKQISENCDIKPGRVHAHLKQRFNYNSYRFLSVTQYRDIQNYISHLLRCSQRRSCCREKFSR